MKHIILAATAILSAAASSMKAGPCPSYTSLMEPSRVNHTALGGLWYEYLYTSDYTDESTYDCASWNMLKNVQNTTSDPNTYTVLHHSLNKTT